MSNSIHYSYRLCVCVCVCGVQVAHALLLLYYCFITALLQTDTFERQRAGKTLKAMEKSLMSWETDANETLNDWQVALLLLLYCCIPALPLPGRRTPTRGKKICVCALTASHIFEKNFPLLLCPLSPKALGVGAMRFY